MEDISKVRRVRTPQGAKFFKAPIGTIISPSLIASAKTAHGGQSVTRALFQEGHDSPQIKDGGRFMMNPRNTPPVMLNRYDGIKRQTFK